MLQKIVDDLFDPMKVELAVPPKFMSSVLVKTNFMEYIAALVVELQVLQVG